MSTTDQWVKAICQSIGQDKIRYVSKESLTTLHTLRSNQAAPVLTLVTADTALDTTVVVALDGIYFIGYDKKVYFCKQNQEDVFSNEKN